MMATMPSGGSLAFFASIFSSSSFGLPQSFFDWQFGSRSISNGLFPLLKTFTFGVLQISQTFPLGTIFAPCGRG